ncbi:MAG: rRNA maturation RNase YbeY [Lachnospiraceae bacterium]|nr:rRNA maturation RNase YbeY [Candidatus Minthocola equi]
MTVDIEYESETKLDFDYEEVIKKVVNAALAHEKCPYEAEVNVLLTDDEQIKELNTKFRFIEKTTDVLSFPMVDWNEPAAYYVLEDDLSDMYFDPENGELILGDIAISIQKVIEQAESYGHSRQRELGFLVAHSMLHLLGYDHIDEEERKKMEDRQEEILKGLGITRE